MDVAAQYTVDIALRQPRLPPWVTKATYWEQKEKSRSEALRQKPPKEGWRRNITLDVALQSIDFCCSASTRNSDKLSYL